MQASTKRQNFHSSSFAKLQVKNRWSLCDLMRSKKQKAHRTIVMSTLLLMVEDTPHFYYRYILGLHCCSSVQAHCTAATDDSDRAVNSIKYHQILHEIVSGDPFLICEFFDMICNICIESTLVTNVSPLRTARNMYGLISNSVFPESRSTAR
jgi:hypothetical protein